MVKLGPLRHRTKSSARTVGAIGFGDLCQAEQFKGGGDIKQVRGIVVQMRAVAGDDFIEYQ